VSVSYLYIDYSIGFYSGLFHYRLVYIA